jgi:hypothetical protein
MVQVPVSRWAIMVAGGVILAGVFVKSHPDMIETPPQSARELCDHLVDSGLCQGASTLAKARAGIVEPLASGDPLPDSGTVPGAIDPAITQANIATTICDNAYVAARTPPPSWKATTTRRLANRIYPGERPEAISLDQLVPISLGGAATDARNLWLQPWTGSGGAGKKDALEAVLNRMVCAGQLPLASAQRAIARNWITLFEQVATPQMLRRFPMQSQQDQVAAQAPSEPVMLGAERVLQPEITENSQPYEVPAIQIP